MREGGSEKKQDQLVVVVGVAVAKSVVGGSHSGSLKILSWEMT